MKKVALIIFIATGGLFLLPKTVLATQAQLACSPTTSTVAVGGTITSDIVLNTRSFQILGADAILTYTTGILDTDSASVVPVTTNTNWTNPINKLVDTTLGKIELDYGSSQSAYTSSGSIGRITFTARQPGNANVNFVFFQEYDNTTAGVAKVWGLKGSATPSNVLTDVVDCVYTVTGVTAAPSSPTSPVTQTTPGVLPPTGGGDTTLLLVGGGLVLAFLGILLPRAIL